VLGLIAWLEPSLIIVAALISIPYLVFLIITEIEYMELLEVWLKENAKLHHHHK
jgi:hypothetical protein